MKKNAVITGGTRGIGRDISIDLARRGYCVKALYARDRESANSLEKLAKDEALDITTLRSDLSRQEGIDSALLDITSNMPEVHAFVHCAASGVHKLAEQLTAKHLRWTFEINVIAVQQLLTHLVPLMPSDSRIIGLTSAGGTRTIPFYAAVGSSKGALDSLFRHWAVEVAPRGIAVNLVCPGMVLTDAVEAFPDKDQRISACLKNTPTGKMTTSSDIAELVGFLCSSRMGGQIIGQTFIVDGGKCITA
jgi:enoyl-[acyl-carrier protein] reductase III